MRYYFELRKDKINLNGLIPIRLVVAYGKIRIRKNICVKTLLSDWNSDLNLIENRKENPHYNIYENYNVVLANEKRKIDKIFTFFKYNDIPFSEKIFNEKYNCNDIKVSISFFDAYDEYVSVSSLTKTKSTLSKYGSVKNFLLGFQDHTKFILTLDNTDYLFEETFMKYCFQTKFTLNNYYAKLVKTLKAFLNWCFDRGYHNSLKFKKLKAKEEEIEVIYLQIEELLTLYHHNFKNPSLDRARDMYCLMALTGQRHSDIYNLKNASVSGKFLTFTILKTKSVQHQVFLNDLALKLIDKYKGTIYYPIPRISSQKLNKSIQICCEEIGLTEEIQLTRYIGGKRIDQTFRKCDLITSHTGRKSFITNSIILDINERIIKSQTNSKDEKSFRRYVHVAEAHKQKELSKWDEVGK